MNSLVQQLSGTLPQIALPALPPRALRILGVIRRHALKRRRALAVAGSVALHILLILALLSQPSPQGLSGGGSNGTASGAGSDETYAAVNLVPALPAPAAAIAVKPPDDPAADILDSPPETLKPQTDALKTADSVAQLATIVAAAPGGAGQAGTTSGASDDLWAAIAPCWKRDAGSDTLPVALKITFGATGGLAKPPEIVRATDTAITPQSLRSEAQALTALAECGVYPMAADRQDVEVHFPRPD